MIKLIIVDDEVLIREGLKILMSVYDDIEVVGTFEDGRSAYSYCLNNPVDVALMDIRMEGCNGVQATKMIKEFDSRIRVIILTTFKDSQYIEKAISYGASGYLLKDSSSDRIYEAVKGAAGGNIVMNPQIAEMIISGTSKKEEEPEVTGEEFGLSQKEMEITRLVAEGLTNKEISEKMFLAQGTVKNNISSILSKLDLRDRTQLAIFAYKNRIVE